MKNRIKKRTLGRKGQHRASLMMNLTSGLLTNGSIITTRAKALELKAYTDTLLAKSKDELSLQRRRALLVKLARKDDLPKLVKAAKAAGKRTSGFTRLINLGRRQGDGAKIVKVDLIDK